MAKVDITYQGLEELTAGLLKEASLSQKKKIIRDYGGRLQQRAQKNATFRGHYEGKKFVKPTGATRRSITMSLESGGLAAKVKAGTHYSGYLEVGTRKMSAQPFMQPAYNSIVEQLMEDLAKPED